MFIMILRLRFLICNKDLVWHSIFKRIMLQYWNATMLQLPWGHDSSYRTTAQGNFPESVTPATACLFSPTVRTQFHCFVPLLLCAVVRYKKSFFLASNFNFQIIKSTHCQIIHAFMHSRNHAFPFHFPIFIAQRTKQWFPHLEKSAKKWLMITDL